MKNNIIIIPAYNEDNHLNRVVAAIHKIQPSLPVIIVDDGSKHPIKINNDFKSIVIRHEINLGKGAALKTGIEFALSKLKADAVILMDADGQHDPHEVPHFINYLNLGYDLVFGSRKLSKEAPITRRLGNRFSSIYLNIVFGVYLSDTLCGFRALSRKAYSKVKWQSPRYGGEPEMVARYGMHQSELKAIEIPIKSIYLDKYKGVTIVDALQILINSIWWKLT